VGKVTAEVRVEGDWEEGNPAVEVTLVADAVARVDMAVLAVQVAAKHKSDQRRTPSAVWAAGRQRRWCRALKSPPADLLTHIDGVPLHEHR